MKTIIAGSRGIDEYNEIVKAVSGSGFVITEVVSGACAGPDQLGERWAQNNNIPVKLFPAQWAKFGKGAGVIRNRRMAEYAQALVAVWDGKSAGTKNMIVEAKHAGLKVYIHEVQK